ncbi:MAG: hypothetical protein GY851_33520 [bacterium]|nr:hypothetical protein [bacterium]
MDENSSHDLDLLIEQALEGETMRPVPPGFHARFEDRLRVARIADQEHRRMRFGLATGAILFATLAVALFFVPVISFVQGWAVRSLPGGMGYFDYLLASTFRSVEAWPLWALGATVVLMGTVVAGVSVPLVRTLGRGSR